MLELGLAIQIGGNDVVDVGQLEDMQFSNLNLAEYDGLTEQVGQVDNVEFLKSKINLFMGWSSLLSRNSFAGRSIEGTLD